MVIPLFDMKSKKERDTDTTWRIVRRYLATAEDWTEMNPNIIEGAQDLIAEDMIKFESQEEYELCARLKKAFEQLEQLK
tara:strand:+ start:445 stop:681 length:237 start_codon:yes stop_codon:yes gene_type:complete